MENILLPIIKEGTASVIENGLSAELDQINGQDRDAIKKRRPALKRAGRC